MGSEGPTPLALVVDVHSAGDAAVGEAPDAGRDDEVHWGDPLRSRGGGTAGPGPQLVPGMQHDPNCRPGRL